MADDAYKDGNRRSVYVLDSTVARIAEAVETSAAKEDDFRRGRIDSDSGLAVRWVYDKLRGTLSIRISGKTNAQIPTSQSYFTLGSIPMDVVSDFSYDIISFVSYNSYYRGQVNVRTATGDVTIGYTRDASTNGIVDIPADTDFYVNAVFITK